MAKVNAIFGKATGKVGGSVFQINSGVQIWKEKPTKVTNPNTDAQVAQRAKMKLMSQLAAALAPALAFKKDGLVSARNQFVSKNIGLVSYSEGNGAEVQLDALKLTQGTEVLALRANMFSAEGLQGNLAVPVANISNFSHIVIVSIAPQNRVANSPISITDIAVAEVPTTGTTANFGFDLVEGRNIVYVYGIKATSSNSSVAYDDYFWKTASNDAKLTALSSLRSSGATYSDTFATVYADVDAE